MVVLLVEGTGLYLNPTTTTLISPASPAGV